MFLDNDCSLKDEVKKIEDERENQFDGILSVEEYKLIKDFLNHQRNYSVMCIDPTEEDAYQHVYHAYDLLNLDGALTSTIPKTCIKFCTSFKVFSAWLGSIGGSMHELSDNTYVIIITKNTLF